MKRLLAAGSGPIYCLGKAFRSGEYGDRHNLEFTMLEWYRTEWDEHRLIQEIYDLFTSLGVMDDSQECKKCSYSDIFMAQTGIDPHLANMDSIVTFASEAAKRTMVGESRANCLNTIFSQTIEPALPEGIIFIYDYPACMAALAEISEVKGVTVARRFEIFCNRVEMGNGYYELTDSSELRKRFEVDNDHRRRLGKAIIEPDERLLAALDSGLPSCAGIAIGVDRLLMNLLGVKNIRETLPFADHDGL